MINNNFSSETKYFKINTIIIFSLLQYFEKRSLYSLYKIIRTKYEIIQIIRNNTTNKIYILVNEYIPSKQ